MGMQRTLEFAIWNLPYEDIVNKTLFELLGKKETIESFLDAFKNLKSLQRFDEFYLYKIGNRKVVDYISTLRELNGQVGTKLYKVEHNALMTGLLRSAGILNGELFITLYPNFMRKMNVAAQAHMGNLKSEAEINDGKRHNIYVIYDESGLISHENSKALGVPMGHWLNPRDNSKKSLTDI